MTLFLNNINFVAVPKNATMSIENAFMDHAKEYNNHRHDPIDVLKKQCDNPCIATIRNPIDWIISYYKYMKYSSWFISGCWGIRTKSFDKFVSQYIDGKHLWPEPLRTQHNYIVTSIHRTEHIHRYENIENVFAHIEDCLSIKVARPWINKGNNEDIYFDPNLKRKFIDYTKKDFDIYESIR